MPRATPRSRSSRKRVAAVVPYATGLAPGQRLRIEMWARYLEEAGWAVDFYPFEDAALREVLYQTGRPAAKAARALSCYGRQLGRVLGRVNGDLVFVYREAALMGPAILERIAARRAPLVYDLDDPLFVPYRSPTSNWLSLLKFPGKVRSLLRMSDHVITVNGLIGEYAARYNSSVSVVPMCVDTDRYRPRPEHAGPGGPDQEPMRVVWVGSPSTTQNLESIARPLARLQAATGARVRVMGGGPVEVAGVRTEAPEWSIQAEPDQLAEGDVGVVPLSDHPWNSWKFNYKTLLYMSVGIPVVARRLGSNSEMIDHGVNGFLVEDEEEWSSCLLTLAHDPALRRRMGEAARTTVVERYSMAGQMPAVVSLFENMLERSPAQR